MGERREIGGERGQDRRKGREGGRGRIGDWQKGGEGGVRG